MIFEEQISKLYNEIANDVSDMIPDKWENIYLKAYVNDESSEVFFFYTKNNENELYYSGNIPKLYNVSPAIYKDLLIEVHEKFIKLRDVFKKENQEAWTSCEFNFTNEGKLNVSFGYLDWKKSDFGQVARFNYYRYKKFGILPEFEYEKEEIKEIEQFIKEQEEE
ncbi:TIGR01741 family protein [Staphylococcus haemolyticus]|uniref:TIGR01741 family protein n=1 Tax=Staphylococcus haemolyticus TaxID=1283 RepID=UPI002DB5BF97|nr:TIGR01741 family protein [Staphylococcus haemolyticus]MEB5760257.1 TIGR01741 family protein [Staphylococcus haemolyticus]